MHSNPHYLHTQDQALRFEETLTDCLLQQAYVNPLNLILVRSKTKQQAHQDQIGPVDFWNSKTKINYYASYQARSNLTKIGTFCLLEVDGSLHCQFCFESLDNDVDETN